MCLARLGDCPFPIFCGAAIFQDNYFWRLFQGSVRERDDRREARDRQAHEAWVRQINFQECGSAFENFLERSSSAPRASGPGMHSRENFLKGVAKAYGIHDMVLHQHDRLRSLMLPSFDKVFGQHTEAFSIEQQGSEPTPRAHPRPESHIGASTWQEQQEAVREGAAGAVHMENLRLSIESMGSPVVLVRLPLSDGSDKLEQLVQAVIIVGETRHTASHCLIP